MCSSPWKSSLLALVYPVHTCTLQNILLPLKRPSKFLGLWAPSLVKYVSDIPKSIRYAVSKSELITIFSGFRSLWMYPKLWRTSSLLVSWIQVFIISFSTTLLEQPASSTYFRDLPSFGMSISILDISSSFVDKTCGKPKWPYSFSSTSHSALNDALYSVLKTLRIIFSYWPLRLTTYTFE